MTDLKVMMGNLELENPIIISSGHLTRTGDDVKRCIRYGAGAVITKSSFLENEYKKVVSPNSTGLFPDARAGFYPAGNGILSISGLSPMPLEAWAKWFKDNIKEIKTPVIASIMALSVEGYIKGAKLLQEAGAKAVEILLGCPLPYPLHHHLEKFSFYAPIIEEICSEVKRSVEIPLGVKMMFKPLGQSPLKIPKKAELDWMTIATVFPASPGIQLDKIEPVIPSSVFLSGSKAAKHANFVALLSQRDQYQDIHVSVSGGTQTWSDIVEFIMYGASSVQAQTVFLRKGMGLIRKLKRNLSDYMDSKGFASIEEMKGCIIPKILAYDEVVGAYEKTKGRIVVSINEQKCVGCGVCEEVCNWGAIKVDAIAEIEKEKCEGCGLCVCSCLQKALWIEYSDIVREIARA
ncbi:MAG: 4Fe-4S binding protein [Pseudomonadota bacterium]